MSSHRFTRAVTRRAGRTGRRCTSRRRTSAAALAVVTVVTLGLTADPGAQAASPIPQTIAGPGFVWVPLYFHFVSLYTAVFGTAPYTWNQTTCIRQGATGNVRQTVTQNTNPALGITSNQLMYDGFFPRAGYVLCSIHATDSTGLTDPVQDKMKEEAAPKTGDIVGTGADTAGNLLDQLSQSYNSTVTSSTSPHLFSFDTANPETGSIGDSVSTKQGCAAIPRPSGASPGISALEAGSTVSGGTGFCLDFASSSRGRASSDPACATGGVCFVSLAGDAVSYATQPGSNAPPGGLSTAQLAGIYNCTITNWSQAGGKPGTIAAFLPQSSSGTRSFFLSAIGLTAPGPCVSTSATVGGSAGASANTLQENDGVALSLNGAAGSGVNKRNVIFPYSVADYLAQRYHSTKCFNVTCGASTSGAHAGLACAPAGWEDVFSCNEHGTMMLNKINGTAPTTPFPLTKATTNATINPGFTAVFQRFIYNAVRYDPATTDHVPAYLQPLFGSVGWMCTSATAQQQLQAYGFVPLPAGTAPGDCGSVS